MGHGSLSKRIQVTNHLNHRYTQINTDKRKDAGFMIQDNNQ
jgi:hypothetical protein